jgi:6-phosphogluconolactonase
MSPIPVQVFADAEELSVAAADLFVQRVGATTKDRRARVVLAGGATPRRTYELLAGTERRARVDWTRVEFFWSDERTVPPTHPESNYRMAAETLLCPLGIPATQVHRMQGEAADPDAAARSYELELAASFGVATGGAPPRFDFVFLGLGADGHTASLFPHTHALGERRRWVVANYVPQLQTTRLTLTYPVLNAARCVVFLVAGREKASALARVFDSSTSYEEVPAKGICPVEGELHWLADRAAALV